MNAVLFLHTFLWWLWCVARIGGNEIDEYVMQEHPMNKEYFTEMKLCSTNINYCEDQFERLLSLNVKLANEHTSLLLYDRVQDIFREELKSISPSTRIAQKIAHILAVLSFGQGNFEEVLIGFLWIYLYVLLLISSHRRYRRRVIGSYFQMMIWY